MVGDDGGGDLVHLQAAIGFRDFDAAQAQVAGLLQQIASDGEILVLHLLGVGKDFVDRELFRRLPDELMLLGEIFGSEDFVRLALFEQKAAAEILVLGIAVVAMSRTFLNHRGHRGSKRELSATF